NAKAVLQGLWMRQFEFRRTPKYSVVQKDRSWKKKLYRTQNPWAALAELGFAIYFLAAVVTAFRLKQWISLPFLAMFGFGFAYVALVTAAHNMSRMNSEFPKALPS